MVLWARTKASLHGEKWCWLRMALSRVWETSRDKISAGVSCSVDEKLSWFIRHMSDGLIFYSNLWNLSSDIWDQLSEMSEDFREHCIRCRRCHDGWPVTALLKRQLRRVKHVMLTMWLPTRVRYWQVHNAIVCLARLIGALEQLISVIVVVWWHSDYGFSFWVAPTQAVCTYLSRSLLTYLYVFLFVFTVHQSKYVKKYLKFEEFEVA